MAKTSSRSRSYSVRVVARLTGLSIDVLRQWEQEYQAVIPVQSHRGLVYTQSDVVRLKRLATLVKCGHPIENIAGLSESQLKELLASRAADDPDSISSEATSQTLTAIASAVERYDFDAIEQTLNYLAAVHTPREFIFQAVLPLLREVGRRWEVGSFRPSQEHMVSAIVRSLLGELLQATTHPNASLKVVFATLPRENHELGLLSAALLAASAGLGAIYLGASLPEDDLAHAASATGARVVLISSTIRGATSPASVRRLSRAVGNAALWIGGPGAPLLMPATGDRGRHVTSLEEAGELFIASTLSEL
jgi:MerR family transcriptional regulator, light-induced transcriptional regulator